MWVLTRGRVFLGLRIGIYVPALRKGTAGCLCLGHRFGRHGTTGVTIPARHVLYQRPTGVGLTTHGCCCSPSRGLGGGLEAPRCTLPRGGPLQPEVGWRPPSALPCHPEDAGMLAELPSLARRPRRDAAGDARRWDTAVPRDGGCRDGEGVVGRSQGSFKQRSAGGGLSSRHHACKIISTNLRRRFSSSLGFVFFGGGRFKCKSEST